MLWRFEEARQNSASQADGGAGAANCDERSCLLYIAAVVASIVESMSYSGLTPGILTLIDGDSSAGVKSV